MTAPVIPDLHLIDSLVAASLRHSRSTERKDELPARVASPTSAVILTQMPVLAAGLGGMLRAEGFEVSIYPGDMEDLVEYYTPPQDAMVILHGDAEPSIKTAEVLSARSPESILALWTEKITPTLLVQGLEAGIRCVLSTKLSVESTIASLLEICRGGECHIRIMMDTLCRQFRAPRLNEREKQILRMVKAAAKNKEIAYELHLTENTVKVYLNRLFRKAAVRSRFELAQWASEIPDWNNDEEDVL